MKYQMVQLRIKWAKAKINAIKWVARHLTNANWDHADHHPDVSSISTPSMLRMEAMQGLDQSKIATLHQNDAVTVQPRTAASNHITDDVS